jgi:hypothetical protein
MDKNVKPNLDVPKWSETRWSGCWNPDEGVGLYLHMGRCRFDLDLWWAQTVAYLPDGQLCVDRSYGRSSDDAVVRTGCYELRQEEGYVWTSTFDGAGELTTSAALSAGARGSGGLAAPMKWNVRSEPAAPIWDMYGAAGDDRHDFAGDTHIQNGSRTTGEFTVAGKTYSLEGVGFKDHSSGVRSWDDFGGHHFILGVMPSWTVHTINIYDAAGKPRALLGAFFDGGKDGEQHDIEVSELPVTEDALGGPNENTFTLKAAGIDEMEIKVDVLHQCPISIADEGDNINGIDWELQSDIVMVLMEGICRLTTAEGEVGYGFIERGIRRDDLKRAGAGVAAAAVA